MGKAIPQKTWLEREWCLAGQNGKCLSQAQDDGSPWEEVGGEAGIRGQGMASRARESQQSTTEETGTAGDRPGS